MIEEAENTERERKKDSKSMRSFTSIHTVKSQKGHIVEITPYEEKYFTPLVHMYDTYSPLASVQGLPPVNREKREQWAHPRSRCML